MTLQDTFRFLALFLGAMLLSYALQLWSFRFFERAYDLGLIQLSYLFNSAYTLLLTLFLFLTYKKYKDQIGFIFMIGSFLKLAFFLAITRWGAIQLDKTVFLDFFVPYLVNLFLEVYWISHILNPRN